ncbi:hypothetical protein Adt_32098 [Abeliophyllum distichum]|uniref:Uncharacterized protein n=1 Tax=Abeliophyllum distichum TaxID=126358 RepID=A0ABD1RHE6_9LAMI
MSVEGMSTKIVLWGMQMILNGSDEAREAPIHQVCFEQPVCCAWAYGQASYVGFNRVGEHRRRCALRIGERFGTKCSAWMRSSVYTLVSFVGKVCNGLCLDS